MSPFRFIRERRGGKEGFVRLHPLRGSGICKVGIRKLKREKKVDFSSHLRRVGDLNDL